jgi:hypothetical protein
MRRHTERNRIYISDCSSPPIGASDLSGGVVLPQRPARENTNIRLLLSSHWSLLIRAAALSSHSAPIKHLASLLPEMLNPCRSLSSSLRQAHHFKRRPLLPECRRFFVLLLQISSAEMSLKRNIIRRFQESRHDLLGTGLLEIDLELIPLDRNHCAIAEFVMKHPLAHGET